MFRINKCAETQHARLTSDHETINRSVTSDKQLNSEQFDVSIALW